MAHHADTEAAASSVAHVLDAGLQALGGPLYANVFKRLLDVLAILVFAPVVLPLVALAALLIRRDGGPAFYGPSRSASGWR